MSLDGVERFKFLALRIQKPQSYICPCCCQLSTNHAQSSKRTLRHAWVSTGQTIYIRVPVHRQRCKDCGITWTVEWPEIPSRGKVTHHFKTMIARKCIGQSFEAVSREMNVPASTVPHWFYDYDKILYPLCYPKFLERYAS